METANRLTSIRYFTLQQIELQAWMVVVDAIAAYRCYQTLLAPHDSKEAMCTLWGEQCCSWRLAEGSFI